MRFSLVAGQRITGKGGKLFCCSSCHYECQADFNASVNVHHSFFREFHWQPHKQPSG
jgi:transposase